VFTILTICSGNICRSPIAEQLLRHGLDGIGTEFSVISAGTIAATGQAMVEEAAELSRRYGGRPDGHAATMLTTQLIEQSQLVLTATREHRAAVVSLVPRASRYAFTLNEFARLVASLEPSELEQIPDAPGLVAAAAAQRGFAPPPAHPDDADIADPYRQSMEAFERAGAEIDRAVTTIVAGLRAVGGGRAA
jgi:protein-tyrosine phosphatase